ncbi:MAG: PD-(D/E)XK nuclease family protein [Gemmatimonadota bacterium]
MLQRIFSGWDRPILPMVAGYLADRHGVGGALDLRSVACAVAGARAGRRLKECLLDEATARGLRLVPPRIVTIGALPELVYESELPHATGMVMRRTWASALREMPREALARTFGRAPEDEDTRGWDLMGATVARLHREVAGGGHRFDDVADVCASSGDMLFDDSERWALLGSAQAVYEQRLTRLRLADRDLARITALHGDAAPRATAEIWLVGVAELPAVVTSLLTRYPGAVYAVIHAPETEASAFDAFGCVVPGAWADREVPIESEHIVVTERPSDQAGEVLHAIVELGEAGIEEVAIGVTDDALVPYIAEWLESAEIRTHYAGGESIERTAPYRLLAALADYLEREDWEAFAALVRHPDLTGLLAGSVDASAKLARLDRHFQDHLPADLSTRSRHGGRPSEPPMRDSLDHLLQRLTGTRRLDEWAQEIVGLLIDVYGGRRLNRHEPGDRRRLEVLGRLRSAAISLHQLPPELSERCRAPVAVRLLLDEVRGAPIPHEPETAAVEVLGWLELALDDAPYTIVAGVNEPMLPESLNADPFLPDRLRSKLGLLDNARRYARDAFHATALVRSRRRVRFIGGRMTAEGDPLRPSRLMLTKRGDELALQVMRFVRQHPSVSGTGTPLAAAAGTVSAFKLPPAPVVALPELREISVTDFKRILSDPYRYALERHLRLRSVHDGARELDGGAFGALAHEVLGRFGQSPEIRSPDWPVVKAKLSELLDEEVSRTFGTASFPAVRLQIEQLRVRLYRFAKWQAERIDEGWEVALVEGYPAGAPRGDAPEPGAGVLFEVDGEPVTLKGRIDRIDHHPATSRWAILDYKTGDEPKAPERTHRRGRSGDWQDLQLPLYRHLAAGLMRPDGSRLIHPEDEIELGYILLCRDLAVPCGAMAEWSDADLAAADEVARAVIRYLRQGAVPFDPSISSAWPDDPLRPLLGARVLVAPGDAELEVEA